MDAYQEGKLKEAAEKAYYPDQARTQGMTVGGMEPPKRAKLIERVQERKERAAHQAQKASALGELQALLLKNPDVARILELMEEM